jgi:hypothetical protein
MRGTEPGGDEVWDCESGSCGESDTSLDSDVEPQDSCVAQKSVAPKVLPSVRKSDSEAESDASDSESDGDLGSKGITSTVPFSRMGPQQRFAKPLPLGFVAKLPPPEAAPKSSRGQVAYLRQENTLLRNALAQLQREAEKVAQQASEPKPLDFAHLLELAREFGEGLERREQRDHGDDLYGEDGSTTARFRISTPDSSPRGEKLPLQCGGLDVIDELRTELVESRREASQLKAQIAVRDSELATLRQAADHLAGR